MSTATNFVPAPLSVLASLPSAADMLAHTRRVQHALAELRDAARVAQARGIPTDYLRDAERVLSDAAAVSSKVATALSAREFWAMGDVRGVERALSHV